MLNEPDEAPELAEINPARLYRRRGFLGTYDWQADKIEYQLK